MADLTVAKSHTGNFTRGDTGKTYSITVSNSGGAATSGTVLVTDTLPSGLTATAISGTGWKCNLATLTCTRSDALTANSSYPAITLTVNVANNAPASVTNRASVSGGSETDASNNSASDATTIASAATYTISGQITSGGEGLSNVAVTLSGSSSASQTTDAASKYSFSGLTGDGGRGIGNATVSLTEPSGAVRTARTNPFDYYRFANVNAGETYVFSAKAKRYEFSQPAQTINVYEDNLEVNFVGYKR